ncbi:MAG TPA: hypothetical protein VIM66_00765 [Candidatus Limnocylindria bacterium]
MSRTTRRSRADARATLEHELALVEGSIALLAAGGAARVTLTGLQFAERILPTAQRAARSRNVVVRPLWHSEAGSCDIAVEPLA